MLNKLMLIGHTGKDAEMFTFEDGTKKASISLAVTESYKNKAGEKVDNTEWFNLMFYRGLAEVVEKYVKKGDKIFVEGKVKNRAYDDKDGIKRYVTEILATNMVMLGNKGTGSAEPPIEAQAQNNASAPIAPPIGDGQEPDDLPF